MWDVANFTIAFWLKVVDSRFVPSDKQLNKISQTLFDLFMYSVVITWDTLIFGNAGLSRTENCGRTASLVTSHYAVSVSSMQECPTIQTVYVRCMNRFHFKLNICIYNGLTAMPSCVCNYFNIKYLVQTGLVLCQGYVPE